MFRMTKLLAGAAGLAALATAAPSTAQYYGSNAYGYNQYNNQYGNQYSGYGYNQYNGYSPYAMNTGMATQQCTAAVQHRLYTRTGLAGILGSLVGAYGTSPRVVSITRVSPTNYGTVRVRGLASSGRTSGYGYGYNQADLSFRCDVDARGYVRNVDINRRY
jgi:hypothetical protein